MLIVLFIQLGDSDVYDNVAAKRKAKGKKPGMEEDIYGDVGDNDEALYDKAGGRKGVKYGEDGIYDNTGGAGL